MRAGPAKMVNFSLAHNPNSDTHTQLENTNPFNNFY